MQKRERFTPEMLARADAQAKHTLGVGAHRRPCTECDSNGDAYGACQNCSGGRYRHSPCYNCDGLRSVWSDSSGANQRSIADLLGLPDLRGEALHDH